MENITHPERYNVIVNGKLENLCNLPRNAKVDGYIVYCIDGMRIDGIYQIPFGAEAIFREQYKDEFFYELTKGTADAIITNALKGVDYKKAINEYIGNENVKLPHTISTIFEGRNIDIEIFLSPGYKVEATFKVHDLGDKISLGEIDAPKTGEAFISVISEKWDFGSQSEYQHEGDDSEISRYSQADLITLYLKQVQLWYNFETKTTFEKKVIAGKKPLGT